MEVSLELLEERYELAAERVAQIAVEGLELEALKAGNAEAAFDEAKGFDEYFRRMAAQLALVNENKKFVAEGGLQKASLEELGKRNHALYADVLPENYDKSFGNPAYAVKTLGEELGKLLCYLHVEIMACVRFCHVGRLEDLVIREELFLEVYGAFAESLHEEKKLPAPAAVQQILYWFVSDYSDFGKQSVIDQMVVPGASATLQVLASANLSDLRYLYAYGQYVSENELQIADFLLKQPEDTIAKMADTYTEGYRIGFEVAGKDLGRKKTAELIFPIGFERMMKRAAENLKKMGLEPVARDQSWGYWYGAGTGFSTSPNRQYEFDHREDHAL
ncbi:MAG: leucyl aminopeptidase, partial [Lachnospiraceae bacterium]|nr:leucyl aminopeptidase [Lachnospiraceae bacterium]